MTTTWSGDPDQPPPCKHWRCRARRIAGLVFFLAAGAAAALFILGLTYGLFAWGWIFAVWIALLFGVAAFLCPCPEPKPRDDEDLQALADDSRPFFIPDAWTRTKGPSQ